MEKPSKINLIDGISVDMQESFKDLFEVIKGLHNEIEEIKQILKDKNITN